MGHRPTTWRGVLWMIGAAVTSLLLALSAVMALSAVGMRERLDRRLAEPPQSVRVDLSRPGTYSAEWQMPDYGQHGTEFELLATVPVRDRIALLHDVMGFRGTVSFSGPETSTEPIPVSASDFQDASQDIVRRNRAIGAFLMVSKLTGRGRGRLTFTVERPAVGLAGREQVLEGRPVMYPLPALWPIYFTWTLAGVAFIVAVVLAAILVRVRLRSRHRDAPTPL